MYIIAGLGNPGKKYDKTRHNIGFMAIDELAERLNVAVAKNECKGITGTAFCDGQKIMLVKPLTYMNLSGECIRELTDYYKVDTETELIIIVDDINLETGRLRIRENGSAGGHNGLKSIISHLGHDRFTRIRVGVGENNPRTNLVDHVLGHFDKEDETQVNKAIELAADAALCIIREDVHAAQNKYNTKVSKKNNETNNPGE